MKHLFSLKIGLLASSVLLIFFTTSPARQTGGVNRSATSSITTRNDKEKGVIASIVNRRFTFAHYYPDKLGPDEKFPTILLMEEFKIERMLEAEGQEGTVKVEAWSGKDANASTKMWTIEQAGDEGEIADRFYKVTKQGCCDAEDTKIYFNLVTGQKAFTSTADIFQIEVPNTSSQFLRYVAFHSGFASLQSPESEKDSKVVGVIQYSTDSKVIDRVALRTRTEVQDEMRLKQIKARYGRKLVDTSPLTLWGVDGKASPSSLSGFSIVLVFYDHPQIEIPVVNDHLDTSRVVLPKGLALLPGK